MVRGSRSRTGREPALTWGSRFARGSRGVRANRGREPAREPVERGSFLVGGWFGRSDTWWCVWVGWLAVCGSWGLGGRPMGGTPWGVGGAWLGMTRGGVASRCGTGGPGPAWIVGWVGWARQVGWGGPGWSGPVGGGKGRRGESGGARDGWGWRGLSVRHGWARPGRVRHGGEMARCVGGRGEGGSGVSAWRGVGRGRPGLARRVGEGRGPAWLGVARRGGLAVSVTASRWPRPRLWGRGVHYFR